MSDPQNRVVIVGAGHAGGSVAAMLRQYGATGPITLIGDEPVLPYQRPPLSKAWLLGQMTTPSLALRSPAFYAEKSIDCRQGATVTALDRDARIVMLDDGTTLHYDQLILATGARPIALPIEGAHLTGVLALRTLADAGAIKTRLGPGKRVAIVGGGYIGLELAAAARSLGTAVVILEREARPLARVACEALSQLFRTHHERRGTRFELGVAVTAFAGRGSQVSGVALADGRVIACDTAIVGVGAQPNDELAAQAGLATRRGIVVDGQARTSDPRIFAIGDVSVRPMPLYDRSFRLESVPNAVEQARQAACAITGRPAPTDEVPWQWSDQDDLKLQIAGYAFDVDCIVTRGDPGSGKCAFFHLRGDRVQAVEALNAPREFVVGRQLIGSRKAVDLNKLTDPAIAMSEV